MIDLRTLTDEALIAKLDEADMILEDLEASEAEVDAAYDTREAAVAELQRRNDADAEAERALIAEDQRRMAAPVDLAECPY